MERRRLLALLAAGPLVAIAACGSDGTSVPAVDDPAPPASDAPVTSDSSDAVPDTDTNTDTVTGTSEVDEDDAHEVDADVEDSVMLGEPIVTLTSEGGFTSRDIAFQNPPAIIVTDTGFVITDDDEASGSRLLPSHDIATISPAGIDTLRAVLADAGMFADVTYERDDFIADAATTTLVVTDVDGTEYRHEAYALGLGGLPGDPAVETGDDADRTTLSSVVSMLTGDLGVVVGSDELGPTEVWRPGAAQITVEGTSGADIAPDARIVDWPESADVRLDDGRFVDAFTCVEVADPATIDQLMSAQVPTFFRDAAVDGVDDLFRVVARPAYPGRSCDV